MNDRCASARVRLTVLAVLAVLLVVFACRPAWSPDGKRLLFHVRIADERAGIALFDRDTGKTELLFQPGGGKSMGVPLWMPDGKGAVIVWTDKEQEKKLSVTTVAIPTAGEPRTSTVETGDVVSNIVVPPVLVGRRLFLAGKGIARLDLDSGDVKHEDHVADEEQIVVTRRGDGVCYFAMQKGEDTRWEIGTVDPDTLQRTAILRAPADLPWDVSPLPAFSRDLARIALPAEKRESKGESAILVFRDGKLETVLPLGRDVECGSVEWLPDGVTLCASLCRKDTEDKTAQWSLFETTISGSVSRETMLVKTLPRDKHSGLSGQMALSPDGRTAAFSTAMIDNLDEQDHGLYLVDLAHKERKVTKVPFPVR